MRNDKKLTPTEYEKEVQKILLASKNKLEDFQVLHSQKLSGVDGEYEIDVVATFNLMGVEFKILVECKYYSSPVKREIVQALKDKLRSIGAHKGMVFSYSGFQSGAIEYASKHGIALVHFEDGKSSYKTRSFGGKQSYPPGIPSWCGWMMKINNENRLQRSLISEKENKYLDNFIEEK